MDEAINLIENYKVDNVIFNCGEFNNLEKNLIKVLNKKKIRYYSCINELNINFDKNDILIKEYVSIILNEHKTQLEQTKTFKKMKSKYIDQLKELYFKLLTKDEMINYIIGMNDEDIRTLLLNIDNDTFTNYYVINNKSTPSSTYKKQLKEVKKNK